jgi:hypothetical protein
MRATSIRSPEASTNSTTEPNPPNRKKEQLVLKFNIALDDQGDGVITVVKRDGGIVTIDQTHVNFTRIMDALVRDDEVEHLLDVEAAVTRIDDRVEIVGGDLHFDGNPVHNTLTSTILRYTREGRDTTNLVRFMERLEANPSRHSRSQLFNWTQATNMTIDEEGYIVGYKGVTYRDDDDDYADDLPFEDYPYCSLTSGTAAVDGVEIKGRTPVGIGAVVEMPRSEVEDDPGVGCSYGLHVGNHDYASSFGQVLLEVRFDPADVVSVPSDCQHQKLRCSRYEVVDVHERELGDDLSNYEPDATWDDDDAFEALAPVVPDSFLSRLRAKFGKS